VRTRGSPRCGTRRARGGHGLVWLQPDVCEIRSVLARERHARRTYELAGYVPISEPPLDYAARAENQGEHAPEADEGREVKMPNHEHLEHPFNSAGQAAKTCHHSHVLPAREPVETPIHRNRVLQATRAVSARLSYEIINTCWMLHMSDGFCQVAA
jgi:hypothetical protein